ncbi:MAG: TRAP transporter substrate-binding protein [bacterium]
MKDKFGRGKKMCVILAALGITVTVLAGAAWAAPINLKLAFFAGPKDPTFSEAIVPWAKDVVAASKGTVEIDTFPGGALGRNPRVQLKLVLDGVAEMAFIVPSYTPGRFPDNDVMELPGIFRDSKESSLVIWRLYAKGLLGGYDRLKVLMLTTTSPYSIHTNFPVKGIADLKGKKIRVAGAVTGAALRALGAVPVGMPITAVAESISKGILSGSTGAWHVLYVFRITEVAKYHYMAPLGTVPIGVIMAKAKYASLPPAAKAAFEKYSGEALSRRYGKVNSGAYTNLEAKTRKDANHFFVDPDAAAMKKWSDTLKPVTEKWVANHPKGRALLNALQKELAAVRRGN